MSLDLKARLGISRHADRKTRRGIDLLVLPEQAIRLGGSGAEILSLVAQENSGEAVIAVMQQRYPEVSEIENEVVQFLEQIEAVGGIRVLDDVDAGALT